MKTKVDRSGLFVLLLIISIISIVFLVRGNWILPIRDQKERFIEDTIGLNKIIKEKQREIDSLKHFGDSLRCLTVRNKYEIAYSFSDREIKTVLRLSKKLQIPEHICFNLIKRESCYDSTVLSAEGCLGYLQLNPRYFAFENSEDNLKKGFCFLRKQYDKLGSWEEALIYYNSGEKHYRNNRYIDYILHNNE